MQTVTDAVTAGLFTIVKIVSERDLFEITKHHQNYSMAKTGPNFVEL